MKQNREDTRKMVGQESHSYQTSAKQDYKGHFKSATLKNPCKSVREASPKGSHNRSPMRCCKINHNPQ